MPRFPAEPPQETRRIFERPESFVLGAISRNRLLVALCAIVFCLAGAAFGMLRQPTYTSSATLQVGQVNPNSPGFLGYVQSASALATAFSRAIAAGPVLATVDSKLGLNPAAATPRLSAEPIPLSPAFRVIATGATAAGAMQLANTAAHAIVIYEGTSNGSNKQAEALLGEFQHASLALREAEATVNELGQSSSPGEELLRAEAQRSAAKVKLQAIENAYVAAVTSQAPRQGLVSLLASATSASSDRHSKVELYGFMGLVLGLLAGCLAAVGRERRRERRTAAALAGA